MRSAIIRRSENRGFTLIELLVVIAIIAILAAILFPVFAQAKAAAKKTSSVSNIKQTSLGVLMYMGDFDDVFPQGAGNAPPGGSGTAIYLQTGGWVLDTQPYIKSLGLLRDPSDSMPKKSWSDWYKYFNTVGISYASNGYIDDLGGGWGLQGVIGWNDTSWLNRGITPQSAVNLNAETIMLASRYDGNTCFRTGAIMPGQNWWDSSGPGLIPQGTRNGAIYQAPDGMTGAAYTVNKNNRYGAVAAVYADNGIFAFADGHAKAMNPVKTNPDPLNQPQNNMWSAYRQ
ncbi:MAG: prepilin-type N-terminal cleavage/methylation domain-containing protein [Fimbriimonas sp.]